MKEPKQVPTATNEYKVHLFDPVPKAGHSRDKMIRKVSVSCLCNCHFPPSHPQTFPPPQSVCLSPLFSLSASFSSSSVSEGLRQGRMRQKDGADPPTGQRSCDKTETRQERLQTPDDTFKMTESALDSRSLPLLYVAPHKSLTWLIRTVKWGFKIMHVAFCHKTR